MKGERKNTQNLQVVTACKVHQKANNNQLDFSKTPTNKYKKSIVVYYIIICSFLLLFSFIHHFSFLNTHTHANTHAHHTNVLPSSGRLYTDQERIELKSYKAHVQIKSQSNDSTKTGERHKIYQR